MDIPFCKLCVHHKYLLELIQKNLGTIGIDCSMIDNVMVPGMLDVMLDVFKVLGSKTRTTVCCNLSAS